MQLTWLLEDDTIALIAINDPATMTVGMISLPQTERLLHAAVVMKYPLESFKGFMDFLKHAKDRKIVPDVYMWNLDSADANVLVKFSVPMSDLQALERINGAPCGFNRNQRRRVKKFEARILGSGLADRLWAKRFFAKLEEVGCAVVCIAEDNGPNEEDFVNLSSFVVTSVHTKKPVYIAG